MTLDEFVDFMITRGPDEQAWMLHDALRRVGTYPAARFKVRQLWVVDDMRRAVAPTRQQWKDYIVLCLELWQGDGEVEDLFGM